jgi:tetratricopeptide (TPR) repeat protein
MKKYLALVLMVCGFSLSAYAQDGLAFYVDGENMRRSGQHEKAINEFVKALQKEPGNHKYLYAKAQSEFQLKRTEAALVTLSDAIKVKADFVPAYTMMAMIYKSKGDFDRASSYYDLAFTHEEDANKKIQYKLFVMQKYIKEGNYDQAYVKVQEARQVAAGNEAVVYFYAKISNKLGKYQDALDAVNSIEEKIKNAKPEVNAKYYYEAGYALYHLEQYAQAKQVWEKANYGPFKPRLERFGAKYFGSVSLAYFQFYENELAKQFADQAIKVDKEFPTGHVLLAQLSKRAIDNAATIANLSNAVTTANDPLKKLPLLIQVAELHLASNNPDEAVKSLEQALAAKNDDPKANMLKATALYKKGAYKETIDLVQKNLQLRHDALTLAQFNFLMGMAARRLNDFNLAKQAFMVSLRSPLKDATEVELKAIKDFKLLEEEEGTPVNPADGTPSSNGNGK